MIGLFYVRTFAEVNTTLYMACSSKLLPHNLIKNQLFMLILYLYSVHADNCIYPRFAVKGSTQTAPRAGAGPEAFVPLHGCYSPAVGSRVLTSPMSQFYIFSHSL